MHNPQERVVIDMPRWAFDQAVLMALEKDTGAVPIMGEILRIIKIKQRKLESARKQYRARVSNLEFARNAK